MDPCQTVLTLFDAECDRVAAAAAMGSLIDYQCIKSHLSGQGMSSAAIPVGMAAVAVEKNLNRSVILRVVVSAIEGDAVR